MMFKTALVALFAATALAAEDQFGPRPFGPRPVGWGRPGFGPPPFIGGPLGPPPPFGVEAGLGGYCESLDIPSRALPP